MQEKSEFVKYLKTTFKNDVDDLVELLNNHKIQFEIENYPINFNSSLNVDINTIEFIVKIKKIDFEKVDKLEIKHFEKIINDIDKDYYLFDFSDNELIEIIKNSDEWSKLDFILAKKILKSKGVNIDANVINEFKNQRLEKLSKPEKSQTIWVLIGYTSAFTGGLFGLLIGYHLLTHKKTLPNGDKIFDYNEKDRKHGERILILGIVILIFSILRLIYKEID
jgi:hypothetical protein